MTTANLFIYGTLIVPQIWRRVVGRDCRRERAIVRGMAVYRAENELFPVMIAAQDDAAVARGFVAFDLTSEELIALDAYESDLYDRIEVSAVLDDGKQVSAQTYLLPQRNRRFASRDAWSLEWFEREALAQYLAEWRL